MNNIDEINKSNWLEGSVLEQVCEIECYDPEDEEHGQNYYTYYSKSKQKYLSYTNPGSARMPERQVGSDCVRVPVYAIASSAENKDIDGLPVAYRNKIEQDMFHTFMVSGADRNTLVFNGCADTGRLTKKLVLLMKEISSNKSYDYGEFQGQLTHLFISNKAYKNTVFLTTEWGEDACRNDDCTLSSIYGVKLIPLDELGENQEYQDYYLQTLGGSLASDDKELVIGINHNKAGARIVHPSNRLPKIFVDDCGVSFNCDVGFVCDAGKVLLGSF